MPDPCLICGKSTEKLHLQVQICYGCAAFYRRSINTYKKYKCRNGKAKCNLKALNNGLCRLCRYNRCLELNLQIKKSCQKINTFESITYKPDNSNPWNIYDMFYEINEIFKKTTSTAFASDFSIHFNDTISNLIKASLPKQEWLPYNYNEDSKFKTVFFLNKFSINSAKLLSSFTCFQKLPIAEKLILHDRFWQMFYLLRNLYLSCEHFGYDSTEEVRCLMDNYQYVNPSTFGKLLGLDPKNDGSKLFVLPYTEKTAKIYEEFRNVNATFEEFSYICIIALWSFHSLPEISESTENLGNKIISEASAKLHEYYTNELRIANYANRQSNLFKVAIMVEGIVRSKTEILKTQCLFNFGKNAFRFPKFEINYFSYKN